MEECGTGVVGLYGFKLVMCFWRVLQMECHMAFLFWTMEKVATPAYIFLIAKLTEQKELTQNIKKPLRMLMNIEMK